jgi:hypothetical protein
MVSKLLLAVSLAGVCAAVVVPREAEAESQSRGFLSFPITHAKQPFRRLGKRDADAQLFNISSVSYLIELGLGTPAQQVKVAIDTGSDELWVNPNCNDGSLTADQVTECQQDGKYDSTSSSTANTTTETNTIPYGIGEVEIKYVFDNIAIVGTQAKMTGVQFGTAVTSSELNEGILGLGFGKNKNLNYNNFVDQLPLQGVANSKAFSVALGNENANGVIIFGGVDTKKFSGTLVSNSILPPQNGDAVYRYWIQMTSVGLTKTGSSKTYSGGDIPIVLDSGSSLAYLPTQVMTQLASDLNAQFDNNAQFYLTPCSSIPSSGSINFAFGSVTIQVPFSEFFLQYDGTYCALGALPADSTQGTTALLGDSFLRAAYVVFDQTSNTISMAQYTDCGTAEQSIPTGGVSGTGSTCSGSSSSNAKNEGARTGPGSGVWLAVGVVAVLQFLAFAL